MKKFDYQWIIWLFILTVTAIASSCGHRELTIVEKHHEMVEQKDSVLRNCYPYEWDTRTYNQVWVYINPNAAELTIDSTRIECLFNEEYVEINHHLYDHGKWPDKHTYEGPNFVLKITPNTITEYSNYGKLEPLVIYKRF
jgi:hypothetical protein